MQQLQNLSYLFFKENYIYNTQFNFLTKFPFYLNNKKIFLQYLKIQVNFKNINLHFYKLFLLFLTLEIITNQKSKLLKRKKINLILKFQYGFLIGCQIILSNKNLYMFLENLFLNKLNKKIFNYIYLKNNYNLNFDYNTFFISHYLLTSDINYFYFIDFFFNENLKKIHLNFFFNTLSWKERSFLLTATNLPYFIFKN